MKRTLLSIAALMLLVSCQKQMLTEREGALQTTSSETIGYPSAFDTTRMRLAQGIANCIQSQTFRQGLSEGLSLMRDGDNEVLIAEIFQPRRTRGAISWNDAVASQLAAELGFSAIKTRSTNSSTMLMTSLLDKDPLVQVLYVPANDNYSQTTIDLTADNLKIVVVPTDYDEHSNASLLAYDRWGNETHYNPQDEESPLLVVGTNERLEYIAGNFSNQDNGDCFLLTANGKYNMRHMEPIDYIEDPSNPYPGHHKPFIPPIPKPKQTPIKRGIRTTSENIVRARFTSTKAMRQYEARILGRPEVQYNAQMIGLTSGLITEETWKDGNWVSINAEVGYWTLLETRLIDFYTVAWTEIDNAWGSDVLKVNAVIGGVPIVGKVSLTLGDDHIGSQCIYYESEIDASGYRTYSLGNTFEFTIQVRKNQ